MSILVRLYERLVNIQLSWFLSVFLVIAAVITTLPFLEGKRKNENFLVLSYLLHEYKTELTKDYQFTRVTEYEGLKHFITVKHNRQMKLQEVQFALKDNPQKVYVYTAKMLSEEKLQTLLEKNQSKFVTKMDNYFFAPQKMIQVALSEDSHILKIEEVLGEDADQRNAFYFNGLGKLVQAQGANGDSMEIIYSGDYQNIAKIQRPKQST